jgi:hypothetical protein
MWVVERSRRGWGVGFGRVVMREVWERSLEMMRRVEGMFVLLVREVDGDLIG